jgi:hypothetical protein
MLLPLASALPRLLLQEQARRMIENAADNENMLSGRRPKHSTRQKALAQQMEQKEGTVVCLLLLILPSLSVQSSAA